MIQVLFQVFGLGQKYLLNQSIQTVINQQISETKVTNDNVISALETVVQFKNLDGFETITADVIDKVIAGISFEAVMPALKIIAPLKENQLMKAVIDDLIDKLVEEVHHNCQTKKDLSAFYMANIDKHLPEVKLLMSAIAQQSPCENCLQRRENCRDQRGIDPSISPHVGLQLTYFISGDVAVVKLVAATSRQTVEGHKVYRVDIMWSNGVKCTYDYPSQVKISFKYKCK